MKFETHFINKHVNRDEPVRAWNFERVDDRRNKVYGMRLSLVVTHKLTDEEIKQCPHLDPKHNRRWIESRGESEPVLAGLMEQHLAAAGYNPARRPFATEPQHVMLESWALYHDRRMYDDHARFSLRATFFFPAEKPSKIIDLDASEDVVEKMHNDLAAAAEAALQAALAELDAYQKKRREADVLSWMLTQYTDHLWAEARRVTRFEQRLMALEAEFQAECKVQVEAAVQHVISEVNRPPREGEESVDVDQESVLKLFRKLAPKALEVKTLRGQRPVFPGSDPGWASIIKPVQDGEEG